MIALSKREALTFIGGYFRRSQPDNQHSIGMKYGGSCSIRDVEKVFFGALAIFFLGLFAMGCGTTRPTPHDQNNGVIETDRKFDFSGLLSVGEGVYIDLNRKPSNPDEEARNLLITSLSYH